MFCIFNALSDKLSNILKIAPMSFDRWSSKDKFSYAFRLFSKYHTYMNSLYWAHVPSSSLTQKTYRDAKKTNPNQTTHQLLNLSGPNAFRVTESLDAFSGHLNEFDNWTRLNTLVAVLSYFETYLSSVVSLSIESDLGLIYSIPKRIDGVMILKYSSSTNYSFFDKSVLITKGTWDTRISHFKEIFGTVPTALSSNISDLEKMRKIRNNVAHAFGRDIEQTRARTTLEMLPIERLSEARLQKYMELIRKISKEIDNQLFTNHIGEFELIHYYHVNKQTLTTNREVQELKTKINTLYTENRNHAFCEGLIDYYAAL
jgi:hypothetical protein